MQKNSYESLSKKNKLLFLAGLFDGEGSFGLWKKGRNQKSFQCAIEMADKDILDRFSEYFGGNVHKCKIRKVHWTQTWRWRLSGKKAYNCINKIIGFMCKRRRDKFDGIPK
tara:strand:- start:602 stop:934 length:333 start_codon:yes stop_codon:yes gene_type:complete